MRGPVWARRLGTAAPGRSTSSHTSTVNSNTYHSSSVSRKHTCAVSTRLAVALCARARCRRSRWGISCGLLSIWSHRCRPSWLDSGSTSDLDVEVPRKDPRLESSEAVALTAMAQGRRMRQAVPNFSARPRSDASRTDRVGLVGMEDETRDTTDLCRMVGMQARGERRRDWLGVSLRIWQFRDPSSTD